MNKFMLIVTNRIAAHKDAEAKRLDAERDRIRAEEQAKAQRDAHEAAQRRADEAKQIVPTTLDRISAAESAGDVSQALAEELRNATAAFATECAIAAAKAADAGKTVTLGQINQRLSPLALSVAGLAQLGIQPAGKERAAVLYLESDVARICSVLIQHLTTVARGEIKEAHEHDRNRRVGACMREMR